MARRDAIGSLWRAASIVVLGGVVVGACGGDDDVTESGDGGVELDAELAVEFERVGESLRMAWTVTNTSGEELVVFDNRRPDESPDAERYGAYVTAGEGDTVEISRRLFPVPDDLEGVAAYGLTASTLAPDGTASGKEIALLPLEYAPAASKGGGDPLPDDPKQVIFCLGVGAAADFPASTSASVPEGYRFARHSSANVERQSVLCSEPFALG